MVRGSRMLKVLILGVLLVGLVPAQALAEGPPAFVGTVVESGSGEPLPYVSVALYEGTRQLAESTTDEWGHFSFESYLTDWSTYWVSLWGKSCYVRVSRIGWSNTTSGTKRFVFDYTNGPTVAVFGNWVIARVPPTTPVSPIYGQHRFETAERITQAAYPLGLDDSASHNTAGTVVIASGVSWPDALIAASVAGVAGAPIILTGAVYEPWGYYPYFGRSWYPSIEYDPMEEIRRLQPESAIIVGGESVVPLKAEIDLKTWLGGDDVVRLWGDDRYGTARAAGAWVAANASEPATLALVATGENYADVLASSALIWTGELPVFMSDSAGISQETLDEMTAVGITGVVVVGGVAAVPASVEASLAATFGPLNVTRIGGADRYETSALLTDWAVAEFGLDYAHVALASGNTYADALAGGPLQGRTGSVLMLTRKNSLPAAVKSRIEANASAVEEIRFLGGPAVVAKSVWAEAASAVD